MYADDPVRFFAGRLVDLLTTDSAAERTAILADLHDMTADAPPGVRALLAAAMAMVVRQLDEEDDPIHDPQRAEAAPERADPDIAGMIAELNDPGTTPCCSPRHCSTATPPGTDRPWPS